MKFLALSLYLLPTFILSSAVIDCFQKVNNEKGNNLSLKIRLELPSAFLHESCRSPKKHAVLCENNIFSVKIKDSLLFVTNRCIKVTSKYALPSVSRVKLH